MERLPRGRHGLSPEFVAQNQRERLIAGLTEVLYEVGYERTTVSSIGRRAGVSKSDFYKHFESKDECFFAAYEAAIEQIRARVLEGCAKHEEVEWPRRIREGIGSLLTLLAGDPALASLALVEGLRAGRGVYDRYQTAVESFVPYLTATRCRRRPTRQWSAGSPRCWAAVSSPARRSGSTSCSPTCSSSR
jgi:AcrR family transcriptional regulator